MRRNLVLTAALLAVMELNKQQERDKPAMCVCGHSMADHIEGFDPCSLCECEEFREVPTGDAER